MADSRGVDWHGDAVKRLILAEFQKRLTAAAVLVLNRARHLLNVDGALRQREIERGYADLGSDHERRAYVKQFNRNRAFRMTKAGPVGMRMTKAGKVVPRKRKRKP